MRGTAIQEPRIETANAVTVSLRPTPGEFYNLLLPVIAILRFHEKALVLQRRPAQALSPRSSDCLVACRRRSR